MALSRVFFGQVAAAGGPVTHDTSGALVGPGTTVTGDASSATTRPASGALIGPGAAVAGAAARTRVHATTGVLTGQGSLVDGAADRQDGAGPVTHATTGALSGPGAAVAGTASRTRVHATSGVLIASGSIIEAAAARSGAPVSHATSGALQGQGAAISGTAQIGDAQLPDSPLYFELIAPPSVPGAPDFGMAPRDPQVDNDFFALARMAQTQSYLEDVEQWMVDQLGDGEELAGFGLDEGLEIDPVLSGRYTQRTPRGREV